MNEKQRWLLGELDAWEKKQLERIGRYSPPSLPPTREVKAARAALKKAEAPIKRLEQANRERWERAKAAIAKRRQDVRRTILFEKTEVALKAIRSLSA